MTRHVILLAERDEATVSALIEVLRAAGVETRISAEPEPDQGVTPGDAVQPLAVLYELSPESNTMEIYAAVERASLLWPDAPLVACRRNHTNGHSSHPSRAPMDDSALKRLGFGAIADKPAQLPALLRKLESQGKTGDLAKPDNFESEIGPGSLRLPDKLRVHTLRAAFELVASLHFTSDQKSAAHTALAGLSSIVQADRWTIYLTSETSGAEGVSFEPLASHGASSENGGEPPSRDWRRALMGDALLLSGAESQAAHMAVANAETIRKTEGSRRIVATPLVGSDRIIGLVEAVRERQGARPFTGADAKLLGSLAFPLAAALANSVRIAEAERLSQTDDLTKLHNARFLRQFLLNEIKRARRYGSTVSAFFLDLDDFKSINDRHGHLVGSHVLMEMAAVILACVRDTDIVARYGGDEFVVILPETKIEQALLVTERVRARIGGHPFTGGRALSLRLTASFGVAAFPQHAQSPQQLIASADSAMYEAKAANKNCVRLASQSPRSAF